MPPGDDINGAHIEEELVKIRRELVTLNDSVKGIDRALVGDLGGYVGLITRMGAAETRIDWLVTERGVQIREMDGRITNLEDWRSALRNRAIGAAVGVALGSAGIGATVAAVVSRLIGM